MHNFDALPVNLCHENLSSDCISHPKIDLGFVV